MIKLLISKLIPSNDKIAKQAAAKIKDGINGVEAEKQAVIAKYATLANECAAIGETLSAILTDGKVDELEEEQIAALLSPLIGKGKELIGLESK